MNYFCCLSWSVFRYTVQIVRLVVHGHYIFITIKIFLKIVFYYNFFIYWVDINTLFEL